MDEKAIQLRYYNKDQQQGLKINGSLTKKHTLRDPPDKAAVYHPHAIFIEPLAQAIRS